MKKRILGIDDEHQVSSVTIENCRFDGVENGNDIQFIDELNVDSLYLNGVLWSK
jgi:hypothetical protein